MSNKTSLSQSSFLGKISVSQSLRSLDQFGSDLTLTQYGKQKHQTFLGCFCTLLVYPFLMFLAFHMIFIYDKSSQDQIYQSSEINNNSRPNEGILLNQGGDIKLDFVLMVNNEGFDNDDNPYGEFVFHVFTNMDNLSDTSANITADETTNDGASLYQFEDRFIPLAVCHDPIHTSWRKSNVKQYCPDYGANDFLYGNYYSAKFSWLRLALHFCDDSAEARKERLTAGKKHLDCKSKEEINEYFAQNLIGLDVITEQPTLGQRGGSVLGKEETSITFSSHFKDSINYRSIALSLSKL